MDTKFIKTKKEKNYTVLDNTFIKDTRLSWKAKGLMTYLLSLPDDWTIHLSEIEKHATDGKSALRSAINELKELGYLKAEQKRENNRFAEMVYIIIENPAEDFPLTDFQQTENLQTEKQETENQTLQNTNKDKVLKEQSTDNNIGKKPKVDYQPIFNHYFENHKKLYEQGKLQTDRASIAYGKDNRLIEGLLETFSYDDIALVLDRAMTDNFCVNNGYILSPILSASVFGRLLNAKITTSQNGGYVNNRRPASDSETNVDF